MKSNLTLEHRFIEYKKSSNYNKRLFWDEGCVKIVLNGKYPLLRAFAFLLAGVVCIATEVTQNLGQAKYMAGFFGVVWFLIGLGALRGKKTLRIHEKHLEVQFDRMNFARAEVNNPITNITEIKYCSATIEHTREDHNDIHSSTPEIPTTKTTYEKISVTRIFLALTDEMKEYGMEDDENPWFDIRSNSKIEAEELAEALKFLIHLNSD
jgi:hypothetical protein|tara:strand:- start:62 stop:688 length:627 start_codon:yes stop_codon:yes gene_type:complete